MKNLVLWQARESSIQSRSDTFFLGFKLKYIMPFLKLKGVHYNLHFRIIIDNNDSSIEHRRCSKCTNAQKANCNIQPFLLGCCASFAPFFCACKKVFFSGALYTCTVPLCAFGYVWTVERQHKSSRSIDWNQSRPFPKSWKC